MRIVLRAATALSLVVVAAFLGGCGSSADGRAVVRGKLVEGSKPFALDQSKLKLPAGATGLPPGVRPLTVVFTPADGGEQLHAVVNLETGTFEVPGPDGKGIKPGRYKVGVTASVGGADYFGGKYAPDKTPIVRDVKPDEEVVIDLTKPNG